MRRIENPRTRGYDNEPGAAPAQPPRSPRAAPAQPPRRAFGSRLVERSFAAEVGVEVKLTCARTGLTCRLEASQASIWEANEKAAA